MARQPDRLLLGAAVLLVVAGVALAMTGAAVANEHGNQTTEEANFEIVDVETNSPVTEGETLTTDITVENTGGEADTQTVYFMLDQYHKDETEVQLDPGESTTVRLTYVTREGNAGEWEHTSSTGDDSSTRTVVIEEQDGDSQEDDSGSSGDSYYVKPGDSDEEEEEPEAVFEITSVETNTPIKADEQLNVTVEVENTGDAASDKRVWFELEDREINGTTVSLDPGESQTVRITHDERMDGAAISNMTVATPDDIVEQSVDIQELVAVYEITSVSANGPVEAGERFDVTVEVENTGDIPVEERVFLEIDGTPMDRKGVNASVNETDQVTLSYYTTSDAVGQHDVAVVTRDDVEQLTLEVEESAADDPEGNATGASQETEESSGIDSLAEGPGFGVVAALVALLAGGLFARRRS